VRKGRSGADVRGVLCIRVVQFVRSYVCAWGSAIASTGLKVRIQRYRRVEGRADQWPSLGNDSRAVRGTNRLCRGTLRFK
jgi:hypothetical protein